MMTVIRFLLLSENLCKTQVFNKEEQSIFKPVQSLEWLGIIWDTHNFTLCLPNRRIDDLSLCIENLINKFPFFTARQLAQVTGKVISLSPVIGNLTRLMTTYCYLTIESRTSWDKLLFILHSHEVLRELKFWLDNIHKVNKKVLASYCLSSVIIYSDASNVTFGAYCVEVQNKVFHKMWNEYEKGQSSTWRELKAIEQAIVINELLINEFKDKSIKWYTDNQTCLRIVKAGNVKEHPQQLFFSIFSLCMQEGISIDIQCMGSA